MSSAAETRSTNRESTSPAEYAAGADRELVSADVTTATAVAATVPGQPAQCDIEPAITGTVWRWVAFGAVITAAVMDLLDSTITQVAAPTIRRELGGSYAVIEWVTAAYALAMAVGLLTAMARA